MIRKNSPNLSLAIALVLVFAGAGCARRSSDTAASETVSQPPDATVLSLSDELTAIYKAHDWTRLKALVAPDYIGTVQGAQWDIAGLEKEFPKISLLDIHRNSFFVRPLTPDIVLLNEDVVLKETYAGQDISGPYRMTTIWAKRSGKWRLIFEQEILVALQSASVAN